jgi:hypothetical protein
LLPCRGYVRRSTRQAGCEVAGARNPKGQKPVVRTSGTHLLGEARKRMIQNTLPTLEDKPKPVDTGYWECECGSDGRNCGCSAYWNDIKEAGRKAKEAYNDRVWPVIHRNLDKLRSMGYQLEDKNNGYQVRINGVLDIYPQNKRYHDLKANRRGDYKNLVGFVVGRLPLNKKPNSQIH